MDIGEQQQAVSHLAFEIYHFRCYRHLYRDSRLPAVVRQAVIYSLLLHMRVLLGFFLPPQRKGDCWMGSFISDASTRAALTPSKAAMDLAPELHKRLAHFTSKRWKVPAPTMEIYAKHFDEIEALVGRFQAALRSGVRERLAERLEWFEKNIPCSF